MPIYVFYAAKENVRRSDGCNTVDRKSTRLNSSHTQIGRASCRERV